MSIQKPSGIIEGFITHAKLVWVVVTAIFAFGIYALVVMNKDEFPAFTIRQGIVAGVYPGATAQEVEQQLTKPLEQLLFAMPEVNRKGTYSVSKDGMAYIYVDIFLT